MCAIISIYGIAKHHLLLINYSLSTKWTNLSMNRENYNGMCKSIFD